MRNDGLIIRFVTYFILLVIVFSSCKKEENGPVENTYLLSNELIFTFNTDYINGLLNIVSSTNPEVNSLKPLVSSNVNIYKVVYKTTLNNEIINASGLICSPASPGNYPVLCFQNGTNTLNANAPSLYPRFPAYQLIESISSMGFVTIIPDYPGFGESSHEVHPYLIADPTISTIVDMLYAAKEFGKSGLSGITLKNEYYLLGYSQGGWATLALHKAIENDYLNDFNLKGSVCGAGPYDIYILLQDMVNATSYPMPVYLGYILNAYSRYNLFTNPVSDIFNEPYASRLSTLYNGTLTSSQINSQLTSSISGLITSDFLSGFASAPKFSSVRNALVNNSIGAWRTQKPLFFLHGGSDIQVNPTASVNMYNAMINAGTATDICKIKIIANLDHDTALLPCMTEGILFIKSLSITQ
jgi:pimeloyl-ACP methyl ester carboxylesterase